MESFFAKLQNLDQILFNVVGGVLVAILATVYIRFYKLLKNWWFQRLLGKDSRKKELFSVVYGKLSLPNIYMEDGSPISHPYVKPPRAHNQHLIPESAFSIENPISSCEVRGAKYLTSMFAIADGCTPSLVSDLDVDMDLNMSFICLGGPASNYKTYDVINNPANNFIKLEHNGFVTAQTQRPLMSYDPMYDYGLILKIKPAQFKKRIWVICAGIGEWGTSGSAWFIANKWRSLLVRNLNFYNPIGISDCNNFAAIVKVCRGQDESATLVKNFRNPKMVEEFADNYQHQNEQDTSHTASITTITTTPSGTNLPEE